MPYGSATANRGDNARARGRRRAFAHNAMSNRAFRASGPLSERRMLLATASRFGRRRRALFICLLRRLQRVTPGPLILE